MNIHDVSSQAVLNPVPTGPWAGIDVAPIFEGFENARESILGLLDSLTDKSEKEALLSAKKMIVIMHSLEHSPVNFLYPNNQADTSIQDLALVLNASKDIVEALSRFKSDQAKQAYTQLERQRLAMSYRLEAVNGGLDVNPVSERLYTEMKSLAAEWKSTQKLMDSQELTQNDLNALEELAKYGAYSELLARDDQLLQDAFNWILRDHLPVAVFAQFPAHMQLINENHLAGRLGHFSHPHIAVKKNEVEKGKWVKTLEVRVEGKWVNILDHSKKVLFRGNYQLTIKEIFKSFKDKDLRVGNLEVLNEGISNWNCHKLGYYDADQDTFVRIDLNKQEWWKQLPTLETLSFKEASERYESQLDGEKWVLAARASRRRQALDPDESHAFFEVAIPDENQLYHVYTFGKFAINYTTNMIETALAFTDNLEACVAYPDENVFYSERQQARYSFVVTPEEGMGAMESVRNDMLNSENNAFIYQWESENCAKWTQDILEANVGRHRVPNLFQVPMIDTDPAGPSRYLFAMIRVLPRKYWTGVLSFLHYPLGAWRSKEVNENGRSVLKTISRTFFWRDKIVYLPAMIYEQERIQSYKFLQSTWNHDAKDKPALVVNTRGSV